MITMITTTMITMTMTARNVRTHTHRLSLTDGPRECSRHELQVQAQKCAKEHLRRGGTIGHTLSSNEQCAPVAGSFSLGGMGGRSRELSAGGR
jgi:hypothetical protein